MYIRTEKEFISLISSFAVGKKGIGEGLVIRKQSGNKSGGVYFKGIYRNKSAEQREIHIGTYGKGIGEITLKQAREKWEEIKCWSRVQGKEPCDFTKEKKQILLSQKTFNDAVQKYLEVKKAKIKPTTFKEYQMKLNNQIMPLIGGTTELKELEWANGGRRLVMDAVMQISSGDKHDLAHRCQHLMRQVFNFSISRGWMSDGRNPADKMKGDDSPVASSKHHPAIGWEEVPVLLREIQLNRCNMHIQSVLATKLMLMTFLRAGALTRLEWGWFDTDFPNTITIPGSTSGLKRRQGINDDIPHQVPITPEMGKVFEILREFSGGNKYVFQPMRASRFPHLDPSAPNNYLKNLGYEGKLRAHGWRRVALSTGIDVLKFDRDVIRRQMGHLPEGKVNRAYDGSLRMDERKDFMNQWSQLLIETGLKV